MSLPKMRSPSRRCARSLRATLIVGASALAVCAATPSAFAATADAADGSTEAAAVGEIVVTAERREASILKVPLAISAISGADFSQKHLNTLSDLSAQLPNVAISSSRGNSLTDVSIRGVGVANDFSPNQASPVGVYVDDSYEASRIFSGAQAYDLDRVEVLRGPQGTLFGRNTTGGLVNFITRAPKLAGDNGWIEGGYGNFNDVRVQGAYEHTFQPDVFGVRIAGTYEHHDGYYHNINPGQADPDDLNTIAGRIEARWRPVEWLDTTLKVYAQHDFNHQWASRAKLVDGTKEIPDKPFDVNNTTGSFRTGSTGAQFKARIDLRPNWTLTELASYDAGYLNLDAVDFSGRPTTATTFGHLLQFQKTDFRQYNEELRVNYDGDRLHAVAGAYVGRDTVHDNEEYDLVTVIPVSPRFRYDQIRVSEAVFAQVDMDVATNLTLTGGLRYTHDTNSYENGHADVAVPLVPGGLLNTLPGAGSPQCPGLTCPNATQPTQRGVNDALTGRLGLRYTFADGQIVYASYNHGYRSGAFNGIAYLSPAQLFFVRPEQVNAYEIGAKGRFLDGRAQLSVAAFYNDYRDQQVIFLESVVTGLGPFPVSILDNVPRAHTQGVELEGTFQATPNFRVQGTLGLLDSAYASGAVVAGQNLAGNRLPYSPRYAGALGFSWALGQIAGGDVTFDPSLVYSGRYAFDPTGNPNVQTKGYVRLNATLAWLRGPYAARLWTNNLTNEKYNTYGIDVTQNTGNYAFVGAPPRTFGVTLSRTF